MPELLEIDYAVLFATRQHLYEDALKFDRASDQHTRHLPGDWRYGWERYSFAAITDEPLPEVAATGHQRTIITIQEKFLQEWLSPGRVGPKRLEEILSDKEKPYYVHQNAA